MSSISVETEPNLQAPGAGLPWAELRVARLLFAVRRLTGTRDSFTRDFQRERARVEKLVNGVGEEEGGHRVLIARPPGMEDSSRNWSVWMVLEHLRIIHTTISGVIRQLAEGKTPPGRASTAGVKPAPGITGEVRARYEEACDTLLATVAGISSLKTSARYEHPWFGALDAEGWHAMSGMHLQLHRVQIERILRGLRAKQSGT